MISQQLTYEERRELLTAARSAAIGMTEFWDALKQVEDRLGVEFDNTLGMIESLAADCDYPPGREQISLDAVMDVLDTFGAGAAEEEAS
jgi:hypothetical protein